jgi:hypothetical protein
MNKGKSFPLARAAFVSGVSAAFILWAAGQHAEEPLRQVSGPEDLRRELRRAQAASLPSDGLPVFFDAGGFVLTGNTEGASALAGGLVPVAGEDGAPRWPVTLSEDPLTRETVFLNAGGEEACRLAPPPGYDPAWPLAAALPDGAPGWADAAAYDPAWVVMTAWLTAADAAPAAGGGGGAGAFGEGPVPASAGAVPVPEGDAAGTASAALAASAPVFPASAGDPGAATNGTTAVPGFRAPPAARAVYVDARRGEDALTGLAPAPSRDAGGGTADGPKRTVRAGVGALRDGGRLVIMDGTYAEGLDVRGLKADVRVQGNVVLARPRPAPASGGDPPRAEGGDPAPTGTVARAASPGIF